MKKNIILLLVIFVILGIISFGAIQIFASNTSTTESSETGEIDINISEVDLGSAIDCNEEEAELKPLVISPMDDGGLKIAWMSTDGKINVSTLDSDNEVKEDSTISIEGNDFSDMIAHDDGGAILVTRSKESGDESLLNNPPSTAIPCYGMHLVRFDDSGNELWETEMTNDTLPYTDNAIFIWWYAHHGRIAFNGTNYAAYYGAAISVSGDIHQGDRETIVSSDGVVQSGGWEWGCSHSGYERVIWDSSQEQFAGICKTDNQDRIMYNVDSTVKSIDLYYSNLGNLVADGDGGYWMTVSDIEDGQTASQDGYADVHLVHYDADSSTTDEDTIIADQTDLNERAPHLAKLGDDKLIAAWETSPSKGEISYNDQDREFYVQVYDMDGNALTDSTQVDIKGNRYQDLVSFPDGSVAFVAPGTDSSTVNIAKFSMSSDDSETNTDTTETPEVTDTSTSTETSVTSTQTQEITSSPEETEIPTEEDNTNTVSPTSTDSEPTSTNNNNWNFRNFYDFFLNFFHRFNGLFS
jgi:ribosomal protein S4E